MIVTMLSIVGIILSLYSIYVEHKVHMADEGLLEEEFVALCDIEQIGASCSAVFQMPEGKLLSYFGIVPKDSIFDLPNGFLGIAYYGVCLTREVFGMKNVLTWNKFIFFASSSALMASIFLAIRLTQLRELCVLCWSTHLINSSLFYVNYKRFNLSKNRGFELNTESEKKSL